MPAQHRKAGSRKRTTRHAPDGATVPEPGPDEVPEGLTRHVVDLALAPGDRAPTREALAALARATDPEPALEGDLAEMEREAGAVLEASGTSRPAAYRLPAHAPARLAVELIDRLARCRKLLETSTPSRRDAAELARTFAKAREVRLLAAFKGAWERDTLSNRRQRRSGTASGRKSAQRCAEPNARMAETARRIQAEHPEWSREAVFAEAGLEHGVTSAKTACNVLARLVPKT